MKLFLLSITTIFSASLIGLTLVLAQSQRITCLRDRNIIINGRSFEDVRNEIANSPEAQNGNSNNGNYNPSNNNPNFQGEINNLYVQVLGSNPNSNDFRNYNSQNWSFEQARRNLANSQEFNLSINNLYREFLGQNADNNGLQSYQN